jgi:two-component system, NarL family, invasion response regulator UvrY
VPHAAHKPPDSPPREAQIRVVTVDDDVGFRRLAREVIRATPGFRSVGEATSGERGVSLVALLRPELVLMDVRMPGIGGIEAARRIANADERVAVVLMSAHPAAVDTELTPGRTIALVAKERLGPRSLRALWDARCPPRRRSRPARASAGEDLGLLGRELGVREDA